MTLSFFVGANAALMNLTRRRPWMNWSIFGLQSTQVQGTYGRFIKLLSTSHVFLFYNSPRNKIWWWCRTFIRKCTRTQDTIAGKCARHSRRVERGKAGRYHLADRVDERKYAKRTRRSLRGRRDSVSRRNISLDRVR